MVRIGKHVFDVSKVIHFQFMVMPDPGGECLDSWGDLTGPFGVSIDLEGGVHFALDGDAAREFLDLFEQFAPQQGEGR